jgi:hypothetical protein
MKTPTGKTHTPADQTPDRLSFDLGMRLVGLRIWIEEAAALYDLLERLSEEEKSENLAELAKENLQFNLIFEALGRSIERMPEDIEEAEKLADRVKMLLAPKAA